MESPKSSKQNEKNAELSIELEHLLKNNFRGTPAWQKYKETDKHRYPS